MELLIVLGYVVIPAAAVIASFFSGDADSSTGDGMILGCFLLAVPLWPLTMSFWLWYVLKRRGGATSREA